MNCRHCASALRQLFIDLGTCPPSNAYLSEADLQKPERNYPLRVFVCETCWLVQTEDFAAAAELFNSDYAYFASTSRTALDHAKAYVAATVERFKLGPASCVAEVAANDGYLLQYVREQKISCYGIEPTRVTANAARAKGIEIVEEFFGTDLATSLVAARGRADLIAANNVLAHVPDINDFVRGFSILLKPDGVATFEFPYLVNLVAGLQFDTIYHEHFSYLSLATTQRILSENRLRIFDVEQLETHGGSLRIYADLAGRDGARPVSSKLQALLKRERQAGVQTLAYYQGFQPAVDRIKQRFLAYLQQSKAAGLRLAAYGAAAKGNTLLNYAGVGADQIPYVVDKAEAKQGKYLPGSRIPIVGESRLQADKPDRVVVFPWNLRTEIERQLHYIRDWGGKFVYVIPDLIEA